MGRKQAITAARNGREQQRESTSPPTEPQGVQETAAGEKSPARFILLVWVIPLAILALAIVLRMSGMTG